jgi:hypothetical protein
MIGIVSGLYRTRLHSAHDAMAWRRDLINLSDEQLTELNDECREWLFESARMTEDDAFDGFVLKLSMCAAEIEKRGLSDDRPKNV